MLHRSKQSRRIGPDCLGGGVGSNQCWIGSLKVQQLSFEQVIVSVGDLGSIVGVVPLIVVTNHFDQLSDTAFGAVTGESGHNLLIAVVREGSGIGHTEEVVFVDDLNGRS